MKTRTARERAEEAARESFPFDLPGASSIEIHIMQSAFIDGANWQAARDAEPTTVTADGRRQAALQFFNSHTQGHERAFDALSPLLQDSWTRASDKVLRAANIRTEGDEA